MCGGNDTPEVDPNYPLVKGQLKVGNLYIAKFLGPSEILMATDEGRVVEIGTGVLWYQGDEEFAPVADEYIVYSV